MNESKYEVTVGHVVKRITGIRPKTADAAIARPLADSDIPTQDHQLDTWDVTSDLAS